MEMEVAQIFTQHWVCVGHLGDLAAPGSYLSGSYLDMPWVITRAEDSKLRAFHNVSIPLYRWKLTKEMYAWAQPGLLISTSAICCRQACPVEGEQA